MYIHTYIALLWLLHTYMYCACAFFSIHVTVYDSNNIIRVLTFNNDLCMNILFFFYFGLALRIYVHVYTAYTIPCVNHVSSTA